MKASIEWLKEYSDIDVDTIKLGDILTMTGSKVENIEQRGNNIKNVVVGKILEVTKHPDADKLVVTKIDIIRLVIAIVALLGGFYNLYSLFKTKENGCNVTTKKDRQKILERIKKFTSEKNLILSVIGVIALAISVNLIELACSAGLPVMFTQILAINNLTGIQYISYILLYILFFLIDDLIIFIIAVTSMKVSGMSVKYGKISKLIGAILLILIGILLIFKPEWLMLNF